MSILIAAHSLEELDLHTVGIHICGKDKLVHRGDHVFIVALDHIDRVAGVVQNLGDFADAGAFAEDLHTHKFGGKDHIGVNILPEELDHLAAHGLGGFHGIDAFDFYQVAGFLNPDLFQAVFPALNAAAVKIAEHFRVVQPAEYLHFSPKAVGGDNLTGFYHLESHIIPP